MEIDRRLAQPPLQLRPQDVMFWKTLPIRYFDLGLCKPYLEGRTRAVLLLAYLIIIRNGHKNAAAMGDGPGVYADHSLCRACRYLAARSRKWKMSAATTLTPMKLHREKTLRSTSPMRRPKRPSNELSHPPQAQSTQCPQLQWPSAGPVAEILRQRDQFFRFRRHRAGLD